MRQCCYKKNFNITIYNYIKYKYINTFSEGQIESRLNKLEDTYEKWEKKNFPNKKNKEKASKILENIKQQHKTSDDVENIVKERFLS